MKKILLSISASLLVIGAVNAQEDNRALGTTNKIGQNILPAAGDIAIGVDASPFLRYIGNIFTDANNNAPSFDGREGTVFGKYFLTDKTAVRARLSFDFSSDKDTRIVSDDVNFATNPEAQLTDSRTIKNNNIELGLGYELRRGYGRLQGFYGAEASVGFGNSSTSYKYGNAITSTNTVPSNDFGMGATRTLSSKDGKFAAVGVGAFAGVEYFIAPKISLAGELGAAIRYVSEREGEVKTERWDGTKNAVETKTVDFSDEKESNFGFGTVTSGRISVAFHF